jgi:hypothetical protein
MNTFIGCMYFSFSSARFPMFCKTFAINVKVLLARASVFSSISPNNFGPKTAGAKNRRIIKPETEVYWISRDSGYAFFTLV